jgi:hypothetical protein
MQSSSRSPELSHSCPRRCSRLNCQADGPGHPCHSPYVTLDLSDGDLNSPTFCFLPSLIPMASSARFVSSLRRSALSARAPTRFQCLRPAYQVRWNGNTPTPTSATSEPHQPDADGGVKGKAAPAKTIKYTSEKSVTQHGFRKDCI